eukprot:768429-Hanusia_phi.AAC.10
MSEDTRCCEGMLLPASDPTCTVGEIRGKRRVEHGALLGRDKRVEDEEDVDESRDDVDELIILTLTP